MWFVPFSNTINRATQHSVIVNGNRFMKIHYIYFFIMISFANFAMAESKVALIIGNGKYQHTSQLDNSVNDAVAITKKLRRLGWDVLLHTNVTKRQIDQAVYTFSKKISRSNVAMFYYAGHAIQVNGVNYLIPTDAKLKSEFDIDFQVVDINLIIRQLERRRGTNLVFLDACRSNPFKENLMISMKSSGRSMNLGRGLKIIKSGGVGTLIAYAAQPDAEAEDGVGNHSPFTGALLKYIDLPGLEISQLLKRIRNEVMKQTKNKQIPWDHSSLTDDFYFVSGKNITSYGVIQTTTNTIAEAWNVAKNSQSILEIESFLTSFSDNPYTFEAKKLLNKLKKEQSQTITNLYQVFTNKTSQADYDAYIGLLNAPDDIFYKIVTHKKFQGSYAVYNLEENYAPYKVRTEYYWTHPCGARYIEYPSNNKNDAFKKYKKKCLLSRKIDEDNRYKFSFDVMSETFDWLVGDIVYSSKIKDKLFKSNNDKILEKLFYFIHRFWAEHGSSDDEFYNALKYVLEETESIDVNSKLIQLWLDPVK